MDHQKDRFIRLAIDCQVLSFGEYTLKSGRISPYFFNAGLFYQGKALHQLGQFYAARLVDEGISFQHLFGPAYKGLPLATATAIALSELGIETTVTFNRKEIKDHGERGQLIGSPLSGNTIIVDDVITAGTAFREAQEFIKNHGGTLTGIVIAFDRCERGNSERSALTDITDQGIAVYSIITFFDLVEYLRRQNAPKKVDALMAYHREFGVTNPLL